MTQYNSRFPFGLSPIANYEEISRRYGEAIPELAKEYPLPPALPSRHPLLAQLEGRYEVQDHLPPWWSSCVDAVTQQCPCLKSLLHAVSLQEFRRGSIDQQRWKVWRNVPCLLSGEQQKPVVCWRNQGPGLYKIMAEVLPVENRSLWLERFVRRGEKDLPADLDLVITADPTWWLNMGNGRGWYSCAHELRNEIDSDKKRSTSAKCSSREPKRPEKMYTSLEAFSPERRIIAREERG